MGKRKKSQKINGWINLIKPYDMGSTPAVSKVRRLFDAQKAGHAGTLDPLADGILPIALGEATKTVPYIQDREKTYIFEVSWGEQRDTDDLEGDVIETSDNRPDQKSIEEILPKFIGEIEQTPPQYSAIKIDGKRAYDLARSGQDVAIKSRIVYIEDISIIEHDTNKTKFKVLCGKGTYVRSLARDFGIILGCFGYVSSLHRSAVGNFTVENAISLDKLEKISNIAELYEFLLPVETPLDDILELAITEAEASRIKNGQSLTLISRYDVSRLEQIGCDIKSDYEDEVLITCKQKAIAIAVINKTVISPVKVFNL